MSYDGGALAGVGSAGVGYGGGAAEQTRSKSKDAGKNARATRGWEWTGETPVTTRTGAAGGCRYVGVGRADECVRPYVSGLAAAAGAAAAHAFVATAVSNHDGSADVATGGVSHVDQAGERVGGVDGAGSQVAILW